MKKTITFLWCLFFLIGICGVVNATLITIGTATYEGAEYNLIWDNDNNGKSVIWLDYTHLEMGDWNSQTTWVSGLDATLTYTIDSDYNIVWNDDAWRLPSAGVNAQIGYHQSTSELGDLFYNEFNFTAGGHKTAGTLNAFNFDHLVSDHYWTETPYKYNPSDYFHLFGLYNGYQDYRYNQYGEYAMAIREGQVSPVPEPSTMLLFGLGIIGLAGARRKLTK